MLFPVIFTIEKGLRLSPHCHENTVLPITSNHQFYAGVWTNENHDMLDIDTHLVEDLVVFSLIFSWPC